MSLLVYGKNAVELDERVAELRAQLDPTGFSTSLIDVQASSIDEIRGACQSVPFFGGERLIVLRNPIATAKRGVVDADEGEAPEGMVGRVSWSDLSDTLAGVPDSTNLIVRHDGALADGHFLVKFAKKHGWTTLQFKLAANAELVHWVHARLERSAAEFGLRVNSDVAPRLVQRLYPTFVPNPSKWDEITPDARLLVTEIDKLACAAVNVIDSRLVDELVADRGGYKAFALNEQVFTGQTQGALKELDDVLATGEPAQRVVALVASELSGIAAAGHLTEFGVATVAAASGVSDRRLPRMAQAAHSVAPGTLRNAAEVLRSADVAEKSGRGAKMGEAIVPLIAELAETLRAGRRV